MDKIAAGDNFALLRFGDGERKLIEGQAVVAQEGWCSTGKTKLGDALYDALSLTGDNVYIGISCPCCSADDYRFYLNNIKTKNVTFANIFVNINYPDFLMAFEGLKREAVVIANHRGVNQRIANLCVKKYYPISDDCVNYFETEFPKLMNSIKDENGNVRDMLYVISAGPLAEPIIYELYNNNPNNCYIDFGSSIDKYIHRKDTRPYTDPNSTYGMRNCWMYAPDCADLLIKHRLQILGKIESYKKVLQRIKRKCR